MNVGKAGRQALQNRITYSTITEQHIYTTVPGEQNDILYLENEIAYCPLIIEEHPISPYLEN